MGIGLKSIGRLQGRAIVRDKDGNVKGELIIDSELDVEKAAAIAGKSPEELLQQINSQHASSGE